MCEPAIFLTFLYPPTKIDVHLWVRKSEKYGSTGCSLSSYAIQVYQLSNVVTYSEYCLYQVPGSTSTRHQALRVWSHFYTVINSANSNHKPTGHTVCFAYDIYVCAKLFVRCTWYAVLEYWSTPSMTQASAKLRESC